MPKPSLPPPQLVFSVLRYAIFLIAACAYSTLALACFDDQKWSQLQAEGPASLLYVWSPRMVLSAHNAAAAQAAAAAQGLQFTAVHDGRVNAAEIADALAQLAQHPDASTRASAVVLQGSQSLCSPALLERDALRHFPTAWVVRPAQQTEPAKPSHLGAPAANQLPTPVAKTPSASDLAMIGAMPAFAWTISLRQRLEQP